MITDEENTVDNAAKLAIDWCNKHHGWKRICDIGDTDSFYQTWKDIPKKNTIGSKILEVTLKKHGKNSEQENVKSHLVI